MKFHGRIPIVREKSVVVLSYISVFFSELLELCVVFASLRLNVRSDEHSGKKKNPKSKLKPSNNSFSWKIMSLNYIL